MNKLIKKLLTATLSSLLVISAAFSTLAVTSAQADGDRTLSQLYSYNGQEVVLDMDVGSVEIFATDEQEIRVEVVVSQTETSWFTLWGSADIAGVELDVALSAKRVTLKLSEQDDIKQEWKIYLPRQAAVNLNVGVGNVEVVEMENDIDIDLGVGHAQVKHNVTFAATSLESGVGEVSVRESGKKVAVERNFVRQAYYNEEQSGLGELHVNVGVGQIEIERY
ncbi:hypothetical protein [uncultured Shewanella sp.]|uniref:hypothetical protein n=1 Tax=Shewanella atlantica TaxID=271099 RepID=UPI002633B405|nr:hypothetical protein [uncultured Shewanella sp.]